MRACQQRAYIAHAHAVCKRKRSAQAVHCKQCTHGMRTHGSALPGAESTPPRRKPHGSAMTPQPTQIFASVTADAPTEPTPSFSRVRSASLLDIYLRKVDGKRGRVERHCRSVGREARLVVRPSVSVGWPLRQAVRGASGLFVQQAAACACCRRALHLPALPGHARQLWEGNQVTTWPLS